MSKIEGIQPIQHMVKVTLQGGKDNATYSGTLLLPNGPSVVDNANAQAGNESEHGPGDIKDPIGASYYVIAVIMVYGFSIIMLIASHIKRKHAKLVEDRQINKYLQEFIMVQEKSSRDSYRHLKRSIMAKLHKEKTHTSKHLSNALFPIMAVALPKPVEDDSSTGSSRELNRRYSLSSRHSIAGHLPLYRTSFDDMHASRTVMDDRDQTESSTDTPLHDTSMDPFEGIDPALSDTSFHESEEDILEMESDFDGLQDSGASMWSEADRQMVADATMSSHESDCESDVNPATSSASITDVHAEEYKHVSWCDDNRANNHCVVSNGHNAAGSPANRAVSILKHNGHDSPCLGKKSRSQSLMIPDIPTPPVQEKRRKPRLDLSAITGTGGRPVRSTLVNGQCDLAAALIRNKMTYRAPPPSPIERLNPSQEDVNSLNRIGSRPSARPTQQGSAVGGKTKVYGASESERGNRISQGDQNREGVWLLNEQRRPSYNGLMREEDPELYTLRHGHGMGSCSPLIKDSFSPLTPPSPNFGAKLSSQPLITPPSSTKGSSSRTNPFFTFVQSPSLQPPPRAPSPLPNGFSSRSQSPSGPTAEEGARPEGSTRGSSSPQPSDGGDQEHLLHITCV